MCIICVAQAVPDAAKRVVEGQVNEIVSLVTDPNMPQDFADFYVAKLRETADTIEGKRRSSSSAQAEYDRAYAEIKTTVEQEVAAEQLAYGEKYGLVMPSAAHAAVTRRAWLKRDDQLKQIAEKLKAAQCAVPHQMRTDANGKPTIH